MDITKCTSEHCVYRLSCARQSDGTESEYQSWSNFEYVCNEDSGFPDFIKRIDNNNRNNT
jgi:hypothetical protein